MSRYFRTEVVGDEPFGGQLGAAEVAGAEAGAACSTWIGPYPGAAEFR